MIDATAYGLSATAATEQNRDALSAAIRESAGQAIHVAPGVYPMRPLTISTPNTHLQFAPGAILQVPEDAAPVPALLTIAADHVTIDGGTFDGAGIAGASGVMAVRIYGQCSHITIRNCTIRNTSTGIGAYNGANCSDWTIEHNVIDGTVKGHGIYLHGHPQDNAGIDDVRVLNNTVRNPMGNGIWVGNGFTQVTIVGNHIVSAGRMGIEAWRNPMGGYFIAGNIVDGCASMGISIAGTPDTICQGNVIWRATSYGIEVANSRDVALANNHIDTVLPRQTGVKPTGIALNLQVGKELGNITITGDIISGCHAGINLCGDGGKRDHIAVNGVHIHDCVVGIHNAGMIGARDGGGPVQYFAITGCVIRTELVGIGNSPNGGVMRDGVISGNMLEGGGISLFRPSELLVSGNRICGENGKTGILLRDNPYAVQPVHNLEVTGNHITGYATPVEARRIFGSVIQGAENGD